MNHFHGIGRRAVATLAGVLACAIVPATALAQGKDAKAAKAASAAPIGSITCGTKKIAVMGVAAAWGSAREDEQALNIVFHGVPLSPDDAAMAAAREAPMVKGRVPDAGMLGFKVDGKRNNHLYDNRVMWVRFSLRDKDRPASLDHKALGGPKMFSTVNLICGKGDNVNLARGPHNKDKVPADFASFSAELKNGGKLAFVTRGKVVPDAKSSFGPKTPASWDIKVDTIVHQFD